MSSDNPCVVWMANKRWEEPGIDRRMTREMERYARILWVDPPLTIATSTRRRLGARRTVRPVLTVLNDRIIRLSPTALARDEPPRSADHHRTSAPGSGPLGYPQAGIEPRTVIATNLEDVLGRWGGGVVSALHGTDDYVAGAELMGLSARRLRAQERKAVIRADVVTALSPILAERWSELRGAPVPLIPNGCTPLHGWSVPTSSSHEGPATAGGGFGRSTQRTDQHEACRSRGGCRVLTSYRRTV